MLWVGKSAVNQKMLPVPSVLVRPIAPDIASDKLRDMPKPKPFRRTCARGSIDLRKVFEQQMLTVGRDPDAGIRNLESQEIAADGFRAHRDPHPAVLGKFQRIGLLMSGKFCHAATPKISMVSRF
jgi:hypothetical protein